MKILMSYFQIHLTIYSFGLELPEIFLIIFSSIGSPINSIYNSLDCYVNINYIPQLYIKLLWLYISPFFVFIILVVLCFAIMKLFGTKFRVGILISIWVFMFLYLTPGIIEQSLLALSCRYIGANHSYIAADVSMECFNDEHIFYIKALILPGFLLYFLVFPFSIVYLLTSNRSKF
jgi:hypothetical protein